MKIIVLIACFFIIISLSGCNSSGGVRIDNVPMYGQPEIKRPQFLKNADENFIRKVTSDLGPRDSVSKIWWSQGEKFMNEGNLDFAMRRYNQSWLLNPKNYQPYWGFSRVMLQNNNVDEAIKYLEKAEALINDPYQKVALLADMGTAYTFKGKENLAYFTKANKKFNESTNLESTYPNSWRRWAYSLFEQGKYLESWEKVKKAQSLNAKKFPSNFLSKLEEKLPRPH